MSRADRFCPSCGEALDAPHGGPEPEPAPEPTPKEGSGTGPDIGAWMKRGAVLLVGAFVLLLVIGALVGDDPGGTQEDPAATALTGDLVASFRDARLDVVAGQTALEEGRFDDAQRRALSARDTLARAYPPIRHGDPRLSAELRDGLDMLYRSADREAQALLAEAEWRRGLFRFGEALQNASSDADRVELVYSLERSLDHGPRTAEAYEAVADAIETAIAAHPLLAEPGGYDAGLADAYRDRGRTVQDLHAGWETAVEEARTELEEEYRAPEERVVPGRGSSETPYTYSEELLTHFESFDANGDGQLDIVEAETFYTWVEENIDYRYDDEDTPDPFPGLAVGDGRPGIHYQQTPDETFREGAGDCEDQNTLEVAFYNHWNITAYQALVNAETDVGIDHAIAIVYAGETLEDLEELLGRYHYYRFEEDNHWGIQAGYYFIVDNTYSDDFGWISGGIEPGKFEIRDVQSLGGLFGVPVY